MTETLAIFGDSYGASPLFVKNFKDFDLDTTWWNLLEEHYVVQNFCEWGTSLQRAVSVFLKKQQDFEKIVFLVTAPDRVSVIKDKKLYNWNPWILVNKKSDFLGRDPKMFDAVEQYYKWIHNEELQTIQHYALVEYIKSIRPDVHLIPCFRSSLPDASCSLFDIHKLEGQIANFVFGSEAKIDIRRGHLSPKNHYILYKDILDFLKTGTFDIILNDYEILSKEELEKYLFPDDLSDNRFQRVSYLTIDE